MNPIGADHASLLTHSGERQQRDGQSRRHALRTPTVAAGSNGRVGHVLRLALVAHRGSDGGNSNLAIATIKALHLRLHLRWGFSVCWHLGPLVERRTLSGPKSRRRPGWSRKNRGKHE